ncbi:hypothetical protein [Escherichia coli]|uniref:hypothetical protein n=1 Tax=Escherichia coli TaxID=562 RepID=UPI001A552E99|nr:hypothetical protein [Escherichia coli]VVY06396.1 Uncharacterised protein [Escherichia coli]
MNINQTAAELQKFADAHNLNVDVSVVLDNMDAGDFITLNAAMDNSDNREIFQILQKYKAQMSESFSYFSTDNITKHIAESSDWHKTVDAMTMKDLVETYKSNFTYSDVSKLSIQELKTIVFEDLSSNLENPETQLKSTQIAKMNVSQQQQQVNPQTQAKLKQAELQRNANNIKVSVPGNQSGTDSIEPVVGIDAGQNPLQSLVVTKSGTKPNELNVFPLSDVTPVDNQNQSTTIREEKSPQEINSEVMGEPGMEPDGNPNSPSPLTQHAPGMGEMIHAIADIEKEDDIYGDESVMANSAQQENDEMVDQIIDFCHRMRGR